MNPTAKLLLLFGSVAAFYAWKSHVRRNPVWNLHLSPKEAHAWGTKSDFRHRLITLGDKVFDLTQFPIVVGAGEHPGTVVATRTESQDKWRFYR